MAETNKLQVGDKVTTLKGAGGILKAGLIGEVKQVNRNKHFFATAPRSIDYIETLKTVLPVFVAKFPASEGYNISVCRYETSGQHLPIDEICGQKLIISIIYNQIQSK